MMKAFPLEYRLRYLVHGIIYTLGLIAPWERFTTLTLGSSTWWLFLASIPARENLIPFTTSSQILLGLGCIAATLGAALRVWGAAYLRAAGTHTSTSHSSPVRSDGPFRYMRNPMYLGLFLNMMALALLMPPTGAMVAIVLIALLQVRLIGAEDSLINKLGETYRLYCTAVPRFLPSLRPRVPPAGARPDYRNAFLSELFVIGSALSFIALGWSFNSTLILKGVLISLGVAIIARAFIPNVLGAPPIVSADLEPWPPARKDR